MTSKVVTIVGARPQFVKAAVVSRELRTRAGMSECLVHTGQHYDIGMSDVFFDELDIPVPNHSLNIGSGTHGMQTGRMLEGIERVLQTEAPDCVLVYGDTNSTLAGALAAVKLHVPVAHIEAGLRSFNRSMPEEVNRVLTDHVADWLFAPTDAAVSNLRREGISPDRIRHSGDVMLDAALYYAKLAQQQSKILQKYDLFSKNYILATVHRAENTDDDSRLRAIFTALADIGRDCAIVMPLHPRTRHALNSTSWFVPSPGLNIIEPVGYLDMVMLEMHSRLVVTDSGGIQKEAYFHSVPCVTLRGETEWVELVRAGWNTLVLPTDTAVVAAALRLALGRARPDNGVQMYGDGCAARVIVDDLTQLLGAR